MTFFSVVLFLHVVSALSMFAALAVEAVALNRMRRALTAEEARRWLDFASGRPAIVIGSALVLFLSGGYMAGQLSVWTLAWPKAAAQGLLLVAVLGAITGRRMRAIQRSVEDGSGIELSRRLHDPLLKISLCVRIAIVLGIVFLMTAQPGLIESVGAIAIPAGLALGWASLSGGRRTGSPLTARPGNLQPSE